MASSSQAPSPPLVAPLLQELGVPIQDVIRSTGLPGFEADIELLIDNFCWQVHHGAPPSLEVFKQIWKATSFSFIHQGMSPVLQPWDYQQVLYSAALNRLDTLVGPFLSHVFEQTPSSPTAQDAPPPNSLTPALPLLQAPQPESLPLPPALAPAQTQQPSQQQEPGLEHLLCPPVQLQLPPAAELSAATNLPLDALASPTQSHGLVLDDLHVMSPTRALQALPPLLLLDPVQHGQEHQDSQRPSLPEAQLGDTVQQPVMVASEHVAQYQQYSSRTLSDSAHLFAAPGPLQQPHNVEANQTAQQPAAHLCHDHMLQSATSQRPPQAAPSSMQQLPQLSQLPPSQPLPPVAGLKQQPSPRALLASSVGALYCLYCLHTTQRTHTPCRIYLPLDLLQLLVELVPQLQQVGITTPARVLKKLWDQDAFLIGQLRKPRHGTYPPTGGSLEQGGKAGPGPTINPLLMQSEPLREALLHVKTRLAAITDFRRLASTHGQYVQARQQVFQPQKQPAGQSQDQGASAQPDQELPYLHDNGFADRFRGMVGQLSQDVWGALGTQPPSKPRRQRKKRSSRGDRVDDDVDQGNELAVVEEADVAGEEPETHGLDLGRLHGVFGDLMRHSHRAKSTAGAPATVEAVGGARGVQTRLSTAGTSTAGGTGGQAAPASAGVVAKRQQPAGGSRARARVEATAAFERRIQRELREAGLVMADVASTQGNEADSVLEVLGQGHAAEVVRRTAERQTVAVQQAGQLLAAYHLLRADGEESECEDVPDLNLMMKQHTRAAATAATTTTHITTTAATTTTTIAAAATATATITTAIATATQHTGAAPTAATATTIIGVVNCSTLQPAGSNVGGNGAAQHQAARPSPSKQPTAAPAPAVAPAPAAKRPQRRAAQAAAARIKETADVQGGAGEGGAGERPMVDAGWEPQLADLGEDVRGGPAADGGTQASRKRTRGGGGGGGGGGGAVGASKQPGPPAVDHGGGGGAGGGAGEGSVRGRQARVQASPRDRKRARVGRPRLGTEAARSMDGVVSDGEGEPGGSELPQGGQAHQPAPQVASKPAASQSAVIGGVNVRAGGTDAEDEDDDDGALLQSIEALTGLMQAKTAACSAAVHITTSTTTTTAQPAVSMNGGPGAGSSTQATAVVVAGQPAGGGASGSRLATSRVVPETALRGAAVTSQSGLLHAVLRDDQIQLGFETAMELGWVGDAGIASRDDTSPHVGSDDDLSEMITDDEVAEHVMAPAGSRDGVAQQQVGVPGQRDVQQQPASAPKGCASMPATHPDPVGAAVGANGVGAAVDAHGVGAAAPNGVGAGSSDDDDEQLLQELEAVGARTRQGLRNVNMQF